jgi:hypothetical protein
MYVVRLRRGAAAASSEMLQSLPLPLPLPLPLSRSRRPVPSIACPGNRSVRRPLPARPPGRAWLRALSVPEPLATGARPALPLPSASQAQ